jgi:hypothetical protein
MKRMADWRTVVLHDEKSDVGLLVILFPSASEATSDNG